MDTESSEWLNRDEAVRWANEVERALEAVMLILGDMGDVFDAGVADYARVEKGHHVIDELRCGLRRCQVKLSTFLKTCESEALDIYTIPWALSEKEVLSCKWAVMGIAGNWRDNILDNGLGDRNALALKALLDVLGVFEEEISKRPATVSGEHEAKLLAHCMRVIEDVVFKLVNFASSEVLSAKHAKFFLSVSDSQVVGIDRLSDAEVEVLRVLVRYGAEKAMTYAEIATMTRKPKVAENKMSAILKVLKTRGYVQGGNDDGRRGRGPSHRVTDIVRNSKAEPFASWRRTGEKGPKK